MRIEWVPGVTIIRHETRVEDDAIVMGSYVDGVWKENIRMMFNGDKRAKGLAIQALAQLAER